jgi:uncharacterized protein
MTYLVTGATGFIGTRLVKYLLARGDAVYYLARKRSTKLPSQASFHQWDLREKPELNALSRIDVIFHLAGEPIAQRWSEKVKKQIYDSRIDGTRRLVGAIRELKHKPYSLISASAVGYYGDRGNEILTETAAPGHDFLAEVCRDWEREALHARELGTRVVPIRTAAVLGRNGGIMKAILPIFHLGVGGRLGNGKQWVSWIHIDDLVRLLVFAADNASVTGVLNASSPQPVTNAQFTNALGLALHRPTFIPVPKLAAKLMMGEVADFLFNSVRVIPAAAEEAGFRFQHAAIEPALKAALSAR